MDEGTTEEDARTATVTLSQHEDQTSDPPSPHQRKRRQSSPESPHSKRKRLGNTAQSPPPHTATQTQQSGRPSIERRRIIDTDKKRGQRLFGGFLGTLAQRPDNNAQAKKRLEIEARQVERAKQQRFRDEENRVKLLVDLHDIRVKAQVKYDEQQMKTRHIHLLHQANFLSTQTEPKLFYKPWELLPSQELIIKAQLEAVTTTIEAELAEFAQRHNVYESSNEPEADLKPELAPIMSRLSSTTATEHAVAESAEFAAKGDDKDDGGEVVVDDGEDTVIY